MAPSLRLSLSATHAWCRLRPACPRQELPGLVSDVGTVLGPRKDHPPLKPPRLNLRAVRLSMTAGGKKDESAACAPQTPHGDRYEIDSPDWGGGRPRG